MRIACSTSVRCGSSLEEALKLARQLEFQYVDLLMIDGWVHIDTSALAADEEGVYTRVGELLDRYQLKPIAVNSGVSPQLHHRSPENHARRLQELNGLVRFMNRFCIRISAVQPRNPDRSRPWRDVIDDCVLTLREYNEIGSAHNVTFALELHINSPFETMEQARYLIERMPEVRLVYDPSHFIMQGVDIRETEWLLRHAAHVHVRDAGKDRMQTRFGEGDVDFDWLAAALRRNGYTGDVSIEYLESKELDIRDDVAQLKRFLETQIK